MSVFGRSVILFWNISVFFVFVHAKPANSPGGSPPELFSPRLQVSKVNDSETHLSSFNPEPRSQETAWTSSARLPPSAKSGGNEQSRYNIRRDGSLSIALLGPHHPSSFSNFKNQWPPNQLSSSKSGSTELRSFSVVLSDVDVVGSYAPREDIQVRDAYSEAGVSTYRLNSHSIHRMNASWRLNPNPNTTAQQISTDQILKFLSKYSATPRPGYGQGRVYQPSENMMGKSLNENDAKVDEIVFHDLVDTLEKLSQNDQETPGSINSSTFLLNDAIYKRNNATTATDPPQKSTRVSSPTPLDPVEDGADLKKLMTLLLKSGESVTSTTKEGAQVVNIVIAPNSTAEEKQKVIFLKNPQVRELLESALADPNLSAIAEQISSALYSPPSSHSLGNDYGGTQHYLNSAAGTACSNCDPVEDVEVIALNTDHLLMPLNPHLTVSATPDGFPLTGNGFLNLNHPNLQFHQALHHLVVNGSAPTTVQATTKTNVINVFVINFNGVAPVKNPVPDHGPGSSVSVTGLRPPALYSLLSKMEEEPATGGLNKPMLPIPSDHLEILEQFGNYHNKNRQPPRNGSSHAHLMDTNHDELHLQVFPPPPPPPTSTKTETYYEHGPTKVDILDLLPQKLNSYEPGEVAEVKLPQSPPPLPYPFDQVAPSTTPQPGSTFGPDLAHLSWILNQQPPPKPAVRPRPIRRRRPVSHQSTLSSSTFQQEREEVLNGFREPFMKSRFEFNDDPNESDTPQSSSLPGNSATVTEVHEIPFYEAFLKGNSSGALKFPPELPPSVHFLIRDQSISNATSTGNKKRPNIIITRTSEMVKRPPTPGGGGIKEKMKRRVEKLLTALRRSAIPTLAAGAAATMPYWVPMVASGRRAERSYDGDSGSQGPTFTIPPPPDSKEEKLLLMKENFWPKVGEADASDEISESSTSGSLINLKDIKKDGDQKWIKVDVITESSSPTLGMKKESQNSTIIKNQDPLVPHHYPHAHHLRKEVAGDNNREFENESSDDVPLVHKFLQNVLGNEWNISTTTTSSFLSASASLQPTPPPPPADLRWPEGNPNLNPIYYEKLSGNVHRIHQQDQAEKMKNKTKITLISPAASSQQQQHFEGSSINTLKYGRLPLVPRPSHHHHHHHHVQAHRPQPPVIPPINSIIKKNQIPTLYERKEAKKRIAALIQDATSAYSSASLLPIWFPILLGKVQEGGIHHPRPNLPIV